MNTTTQLNIYTYIIQPLKHIKMNKNIEQIYQIESHVRNCIWDFQHIYIIYIIVVHIHPYNNIIKQSFYCVNIYIYIYIFEK